MWEFFVNMSVVSPINNPTMVRNPMKGKLMWMWKRENYYNASIIAGNLTLPRPKKMTRREKVGLVVCKDIHRSPVGDEREDNLKGKKNHSFTESKKLHIMDNPYNRWYRRHQAQIQRKLVKFITVKVNHNCSVIPFSSAYAHALTVDFFLFHLVDKSWLYLVQDEVTQGVSIL